MAGLYFYVPREKIKDIVDCGLKLSEWYDREIALPGFPGTRKVFKALINPRDDSRMLKNNGWQCLRLEVDLDYCRVGDAALYKMGADEPYLMEHYYKSLVPLGEYRFGTFRNPEVLVSSSLLPDHIEVLGRDMDIPVLYESSEVLYLNNLLQKQEELYKDSGNHLLFAFFAYLESKGRVTRFLDKEHRNAVFFGTEGKEYAVLQVPGEDML